MAETTYPIPEKPLYDPNIRQLQDTDPASATDTFNPLIQQLINNTHALHLAQDKSSSVVSDTQPNDQSDGDLWFDTSDGPSEVGESGVMIANAVVSDTEPQDNPDLWLQTH